MKAAKATKVAAKTLYRWLDDPNFGRAYRKYPREAFGQAAAFIQRDAPLAVNTLAGRATFPLNTQFRIAILPGDWRPNKVVTADVFLR